MAGIEIEGVYKIFGPAPRQVLPRARAGDGKEDIRAETGHTVGLRDIGLSIADGEFFVVMGLSGSGKSTLVRHLNRLIEPTAGRIAIDGVDVLALDGKALREFRRRETAMVFQRFGLLPHRTVVENVAWGLKIRGMDRRERRRKAMEWVEAVGLAGYEHSWPSQLSGGMQQRVGLARALCGDPRILLMDEPFSALDPLIRAQMQDRLIAIQKRLHKTIVFITHDLDEALRLGDRIAILKDGALIQVGRPEEILLAPANDYVAAFVGDVNRTRVLAVDEVMVPPRPAAPGAAAETGPTVPAGTPLEDALPAILEAERPVHVTDRRGRLVGVVSRQRLARVLAKRSAKTEKTGITPAPGGVSGGAAAPARA